LDITKTSKSNYIISIVNEGIRIETLAHRNLKLEVGSRMLKVGSWKLEVGSWKLEVRVLRTEVGFQKNQKVKLKYHICKQELLRRHSY
jgi:hypothetical protein